MAKKFPLSGHSFSLVGDMIKNGKDDKMCMSHDAECVTWNELDRTLKSMDKLCSAYRSEMQSKIEGIKKAIYLSSASVAFIVVLIEFVLKFWIG